MEFFFPRQRSIFFEDPWTIRERQQNQRILRQQQNKQKRKDFGGNNLIDDPLFGNIFGGRSTTFAECDCINCQMERCVGDRTQHPMLARRRSTFENNRNQRFPTKTEEGFMKRKSYSDDSDEDLNQDGSRFQPPLMENQENLVDGTVNETDNKSDGGFQDEKDVEEDRTETNIFDDTESNDKSDTHKNNVAENDLQQDEINRKIEMIEEIKNELEQVKEKIDQLSENIEEKEYLYCEEMLTKYLLRLDDILTEGEEKIRTARKRVVNEINETLKNLEEKNIGNLTTLYNMQLK